MIHTTTKYFSSSIVTLSLCAITIPSCVTDESSVDAEAFALSLIERYEAQGNLVAIDEDEHDAFQFTSPEARESFAEELELAGFGLEHDDTFRNIASNWIGQGSSSHATNLETGMVVWDFSTTNNSTKIKKAADVIGRVYHPSGVYVECDEGQSSSYNTCSVVTTIASGYNSAVGSHHACEKKNAFSSWNCTPWFYSADNL